MGCMVSKIGPTSSGSGVHHGGSNVEMVHQLHSIGEAIVMVLCVI